MAMLSGRPWICWLKPQTYSLQPAALKIDCSLLHFRNGYGFVISTFKGKASSDKCRHLLTPATVSGKADLLFILTVHHLVNIQRKPHHPIFYHCNQHLFIFSFCCWLLTFVFISIITSMALNSLLCVDVPLRNYSLIHSRNQHHSRWTWNCAFVNRRFSRNYRLIPVHRSDCCRCLVCRVWRPMPFSSMFFCVFDAASTQNVWQAERAPSFCEPESPCLYFSSRAAHCYWSTAANWVTTG